MPILSGFPAGKKVKYNSSLTSDTIDEAATPKAVKQVNEKADTNTINLVGINESVQTKRVATWGDLLNGLSGIAFLGSGTPEDPYKIYTADEFDKIRNNLTASYKLMADINLSCINSFEPIGKYDEPFIGCFDGNGFTIRNMKITKTIAPTSPVTTEYIGLFAVNNGIIKNLRLDSVDIYIQGTGNYWIGAIAGKNDVSAEITQVAVTEGSLYGEYAYHCGGITGANYGLLSNSYNKANVTGFNYTGGITARILESGVVENVYNLGNVSNNATTDYSSGITYFVNTEASLKNSYTVWPMECIKLKGNNAIVENLNTKSLKDLRTIDTYIGLDFENIWCIDNNYPILRIMRIEDDCNISDFEADGSIQNPFKISSESGLQAIKYYPSANYILTADINMSSIRLFEPIGTESNPFIGTIEGNGFTISNLNISNGVKDEIGNSYAGLFAFMGGTVSNLIIIKLTAEDTSENSYAGAIAGKVLENGKIVRTSVRSNAITSGLYAGGIAGINHGIIENSYAYSSVSAPNAGGITGINEYMIENTYYATGTISGSNISGGIVATNNGSIKSSYAQKDKGSALVGEGTEAESGNFLTTTQMRKKENFINWDFDNVWNDLNNVYPQLRSPKS